MPDPVALCAAWTLAHFFESAALAIVATNPVEALRLALIASEIRGVRT